MNRAIKVESDRLRAKILGHTLTSFDLIITKWIHIAEVYELGNGAGVQRKSLCNKVYPRYQGYEFLGMYPSLGDALGGARNFSPHSPCPRCEKAAMEVLELEYVMSELYGWGPKE